MDSTHSPNILHSLHRPHIPDIQPHCTHRGQHTQPKRSTQCAHLTQHTPSIEFGLQRSRSQSRRCKHCKQCRPFTRFPQLTRCDASRNPIAVPTPSRSGIGSVLKSVSAWSNLRRKGSADLVGFSHSSHRPHSVNCAHAHRDALGHGEASQRIAQRSSRIARRTNRSAFRRWACSVDGAIPIDAATSSAVLWRGQSK